MTDVATEDDLYDPRRLPHELGRALHAAGYCPGDIAGWTGKLSLAVDGDHFIANHAELGILCSFPRYRARGVDLELAADAAFALLDPPTQAAVHAEGWEIDALPNADEVHLSVQGRLVCTLHRRQVVRGWGL